MRVGLVWSIVMNAILHVESSLNLFLEPTST